MRRGPVSRNFSPLAHTRSHVNYPSATKINSPHTHTGSTNTIIDASGGPKPSLRGGVWSRTSPGSQFHKLFKRIGSLRLCLLYVPFVTVSATFPAHVIAYVHTVCKMKAPACLITVNGRRPNINLLVAVQPADKSLDPLLDMIPHTITKPEEIVKCLIFVDNVREAIAITRSLRARVKEKFPNAVPSKVIRTYPAFLALLRLEFVETSSRIGWPVLVM